MDTTKELFGITEKELEIYKYLLKNSNINAVDIAIGVNMQRPNVYDLLKNLLSKGLVSYNLKSRVKYYSSVNPNKLRDIYEFKKELLESKKGDVDIIISSLLKNISKSNFDLDIKFYEGLKGMRTVLMNALEESKSTKKEMLVIRLNKENLPELDKTYTERFFNFRRKNNLKSRYLMIKDTQFYDDNLVSKRIVPEKYESKVGVYIYGNTVSFWFFPNRELILAIESKDLTDSFREYFEFMWGAALK